tara:strand:+ start:418 stop:804 length:387 start_codon:yes stop_codon:yes gene_type:complete
MVEYFAYTEDRARVANMGIRELYGMIGFKNEHLRDNIRNGVFKDHPGLQFALTEAALQTRKDELEHFRRDWLRRPHHLFLANTAERRAKEAEYEDAVVFQQGLGAGATKRYVVPRAKVDAAAQRADDA